MCSHFSINTISINNLHMWKFCQSFYIASYQMCVSVSHYMLHYMCITPYLSVGLWRSRFRTCLKLVGYPVTFGQSSPPLQSACENKIGDSQESCPELFGRGLGHTNITEECDQHKPSFFLRVYTHTILFMLIIYAHSHALNWARPLAFQPSTVQFDWQW